MFQYKAMDRDYLIGEYFKLGLKYSETTVPIKTKLGHNGPLVVPFQNCVRQVRVQSKMAASGEHSLTLDRIGKHIKRCSPLKTHGQMEQNLVTEVLRWSSFNIWSGRSRLDQRWPSAGVYGTVKDSLSR